MKRRMSIDRIGMRGSIALLLFGAVLLGLGIFFQIRSSQLPDNVLECTAYITGFGTTGDSNMTANETYVDYILVVKGKPQHFTHVPLGQYEAAWKIGRKLDILVNADDPTDIWTKTMQYRGIFYIIFSASPLLIAIYKIIQFRRIKGVNENEADTDSSGEEKFRLSSFIIPLIAGIPFTAVGIIYTIIEHSILGIFIIALGATAIMAGVFSLIDFIGYKIEKHKLKKSRDKNDKDSRKDAPDPAADSI